MPAKPEAKRAELKRRLTGKKTKTGMSEDDLRDFARRKKKRSISKPPGY
jgi:hypothetical protein